MTPKFVFGKEKNDWIKRPLLSNIEKILDYRGRTPKKLGLSWSDTGFLALSALNVKNGYIDFNADANYGDQELYNRWMGDNNLHKGQVVFTTEAPMGNVAQIPNDALYILSQRTIAFEVKHHLIREDFLATLLRSPKIFNELTSLSSGGTAKGISQKSLSNLKISLPASLDEQSAIGSLFRTLDDLLASYKNNLANYQSLKATMLSKMFPKDGEAVPEIRLDGFEGEWEIVKLGDNCRIITGGTPKTGVKEFWNPKGIPWMSSGEINKKILNETEEMISYIGLENSSAKWVKQNSVLIALAGQGQTRGRVAINKIPLTTNQSIAAIETNDNIDFLFLYTDLSRRYDELRLISSGDGTRGGLNKTIISNLELNLPTLEEQQAIGSYFSNLDYLINSHQEKISQLETLKKKLLQDMFV